ncbi:MAG: type II secretion system protein GspJ [Sphingomonadaceae bacterium]
MKRNGFTLVEMLVALMLFSFLTMAITLLGGNATRSFLFTETALAEIETLERMRRLLAADLGQAAARPTLGADGGQLPAFTLLPDGFVLVRRDPPGQVPGIRKIAWGYNGQDWLRQSFPAIDGAPPGEATALVHNVRAVQLRVVGRNGWQTEWRPRRPEELPRAIELTLIRGDGIPVVMKFMVAA